MDKYEIIDKISEFVALSNCYISFYDCSRCPLVDLVDMKEYSCSENINKLLKEVI